MFSQTGIATRKDTTGTSGNPTESSFVCPFISIRLKVSIAVLYIPGTIASK